MICLFFMDTISDPSHKKERFKNIIIKAVILTKRNDQWCCHCCAPLCKLGVIRQHVSPGRRPRGVFYATKCTSIKQCSCDIYTRSPVTPWFVTLRCRSQQIDTMAISVDIQIFVVNLHGHQNYI